MKNILLILLLLSCCFSRVYAQDMDIYHFNTSVKQTLFRELTNELRCLVCQNQSLAESNATLALDLRKQIADMITAGQSKQQITHYLIDRYGTFISYRPPWMPTTIVLWLAPFVFLLFGLWLLYNRIQRNNLTEE